MYDSIYDLIKTEETSYQTLPITVVDNYDWTMYEHIRLTTLYKNSKYSRGSGDNKPYKNIIRPILNLAYRAEGFDVKDIELYVNDSKNYFKSFLVKKYHEKWARENDIDTFIDEMVESYVDYGGALVKDVNEVRPEVVPMQRIAFCDQTDMLSGPIAEKHYYSPDQLKEMESKGWKNIDDVLEYAEAMKAQNQYGTKQNKTPGKYVEVYEVHGVFPVSWLADQNGEYEYDKDENEMVRQLHICAFYKDKDNNKIGITLYKGKEKELPYKLVLRDKIYGRALGFGGAEELFEPQVWVNYGILRQKGMLDQASKIVYQTTDSSFANRNRIDNVDNGKIFVVEDGKRVDQINTTPANIVAFENSIAEWENHARQMGAATESILGESPSAGTPFKLQELVTSEAHSLHEYRKGKLATFLDEVYRDWVIPHIAREISKGQEFISDLTLDELQAVTDSVVDCVAQNMVKEKILNGEAIYPDEVETYKTQVRSQFLKGGNRRFIEIFKGEMKDAPISVHVNIAGKQKYLSRMTDKLTNVFRTIVSAPQILQNPSMAKLFNQIIQSSGLDPIDFTGFSVAQLPPANAPQPNLPPQTPQPVAGGAY